MYRLTAELIFIMKAFTPRTRDIGDMYELAIRGLIRQEAIARIVREKIARDPLPAWLPHFYQGVQDMAWERDVDVGWVDEFEDPATDAFVANLLQDRLRHGPVATKKLLERPPSGGDHARTILGRLEKLGRLRQGARGWEIVTLADSKLR